MGQHSVVSEDENNAKIVDLSLCWLELPTPMFGTTATANYFRSLTKFMCKVYNLLGWFAFQWLSVFVLFANLLVETL